MGTKIIDRGDRKTYIFEEIKKSVKKSINRQECGKKFYRQTTICQTLNPYNKDSNGKLKTRELIQKELEKEAAEWKPDIIYDCKNHA